MYITCQSLNLYSVWLILHTYHRLQSIHSFDWIPCSFLLQNFPYSRRSWNCTAIPHQLKFVWLRIYCSREYTLYQRWRRHGVTGAISCSYCVLHLMYHLLHGVWFNHTPWHKHCNIHLLTILLLCTTSLHYYSCYFKRMRHRISHILRITITMESITY